MKTKYPIEHFVDNIEDVSEISEKISYGIKKTVENFAHRFENLDDEKASQRIQSDKWSRKEILGHLIDSASNNHQRFVRAQYQNEINLPPYEQAQWVIIQHYSQRSWRELLTLWQSYNLHLAHIIGHMPVECLEKQCTIGTNAPLTIGYIVVDYLGHMQHHIRQISQIK